MKNGKLYATTVDRPTLCKLVNASTTLVEVVAVDLVADTSNAMLQLYRLDTTARLSLDSPTINTATPIQTIRTIGDKVAQVNAVVKTVAVLDAALIKDADAVVLMVAGDSLRY